MNKNQDWKSYPGRSASYILLFKYDIFIRNVNNKEDYMNKLTSLFNYLFGKEDYIDITTFTESMQNDFLSFQKQQAIRIKSHINYDNDLSGTKPVRADVIVKFDIENYIKENNQYFVEKDFYNHTTDQKFHFIIMNILVPNTEIQELIPINIRKGLFTGVLRNIAAHSNLELKNIIKFYWEYITVLQNSVNNHDPESILAVYKDCISEIKDIPQKNEEGLNNLQKINIVSDYLTSISIKSGKDIVKLYAKASYINFWLGTIIITLIFSAAMSNLVMEIFDILFDKIGIPGKSYPLQVPLLITYFILMMFRIPPFVKNSTKRKIMVATINIFERSLNIKPDVMRVFFKNKYMFEYKRLKRW